MTFTALFCISLLIDYAVGDPRWLPHPVRAIGRFIAKLEELTRPACKNLYLAGAVTVVSVCSFTCISLFLLLKACFMASTIAGNTLSVLLLAISIACHDLKKHSSNVLTALNEDDSPVTARKAVAMIVGRDTEALEKEGIIRATIETVAENLVDGVTAPIFWAILFSLAAPLIDLEPIGCAVLGAFFYKSVNTMDSMIGYKNSTYLQFGMMAARLDDLANFLPARITGYCVILAAFFLKFDYREAARILKRDRLNHKSPNSGHTEAAFAGALGVRLGGPSRYFGAIVEKPYIGEARRQVVAGDIHHANRLMVMSAIVFVIFMFILRFIVFVL